MFCGTQLVYITDVYFTCFSALLLFVFLLILKDKLIVPRVALLCYVMNY